MWPLAQLFSQFLGLRDPFIALNTAFEFQTLINPRDFCLGPFCDLIEVPEAKRVAQLFQLRTNPLDLFEIVRRAAEAEFGCEVKRYKGRRNWHQLLISGNGNRWHPAGVNRWLRELGIFGQRSHEKCIPEAAFRLSDRQVGLLLVRY